MGQSNIIYFPDKVQEELINVLDELVDYSVHYYKKEIVKATEWHLRRMNVSEKTENQIFTQLFWWTICCYRMPTSERTIYQEYLQAHKAEWKKKSFKVQQVLASWLEISPGFYYVEEDQSRSGKVFILRDIFEKKRKLVAVHSKQDRKPVKGEVISVMLLPMEDGSFISQGRIIHVSEDESAPVVHKLSQYYERNAVSPSYSLNPDLYPDLLKISLKALESEI
ncbi:hypothetical protein [Virgibacillus kimchii]